MSQALPGISDIKLIRTELFLINVSKVMGLELVSEDNKATLMGCRSMTFIVWVFDS